MKFHSTNHKSTKVGFREALISGLAPDGGLFLPDSFPHLSQAFLNGLKGKNFEEIALAVGRKYITDIPARDLRKIIRDSFNFEVPLREIYPNLYILELFHGPTLAFKDFGARFMSRLMNYYIGKTGGRSGKKLNIIVATSGDTGSAVASGFYGLKNINVFVLYPSGRVTGLQEKQMATLGKNITAVEVRGSFDDCQLLAKQMLGDSDLRKKIPMSSANSINFGRLLPQSFYYFYARRQFLKMNRENRPSDAIFCVPSGNFGNLTAGLMAKRMGLDVSRFIAATNANDIVPEYLENGRFVSRVSRKTISNAMDVGNPSNFARMAEMFHGSVKQMRRAISGISVSDKQTRETIKNVYRETGYIADPHTAVGIAASLRSGIRHPIIVLGTAHPAKFREVVEPAIGRKLVLPAALRRLVRKKKKSVIVNNDPEKLKRIILDKNGI